MCLIVTSKEFKVAEEDIVCYKVLVRVPTQVKTVFRSPFREFTWFEGEPDPDRVYNATGDVCFTQNFRDFDCGKIFVGQGVFHTYKKSSDAFVLKKLSGEEAIVFKCVIPKGSEYLSGISDNLWQGDFESYGSKQLKILKCA